MNNLFHSNVLFINKIIFRLKDPSYVVDAFNVDPLYLKHDMQGSAPDYRVSNTFKIIKYKDIILTNNIFNKFFLYKYKVITSMSHSYWKRM